MPAALADRWLDGSGGLVYHLRALRGRRAWRPFAAQVAAWLQAWAPPCAALVLIGPSAGYVLPADFLARFRHITVLEPDPLARRLLRRRFPAVNFDFGRLDCLAAADGPARLAAAYPDAALLFANVLGQQTGAAHVHDFARRLRAALADRHWASFHDVLSCTDAPRGELPERVPPGLDAAGLAQRLWGGTGVEVCDHDTLGLGGPPGRLALWCLSPRAHHLIEWIAHAPGAAAGGTAGAARGSK